MSGELALPSLEIHNFRGLRKLKIARLGRANLIVGKNNVGKTSVLEAIYLSARPGIVDTLLDLLRFRRELFPAPRLPGHHPSDDVMPLRGLFSQPSEGAADLPPIVVGPVGVSDRRLTVEWKWREQANPENGPGRRPSLEDRSTWEEYADIVFRLGKREILIPIGDWSELLRMESRGRMRGRLWDPFAQPAYFVNSDGLGRETLSNLWDKVVLTGLDLEVIEALQLIEPSLERIHFRGGETPEERTALLKSKDSPAFRPLSRSGDGMHRVLGLAIALVHSNSGFLLIDEFENGLHYTIQTDMWRFIFQAAARLNVQVFATTHSSDCVEAFQAAASESEEDGVLIRLARKGDRIVVGVYDEALLQKAVNGGVEVR